MTEPAQAPRARRRAHPLLRPFPLGVMVLTTFLIVFVLMMARMRSQVATLPLANNHALVQDAGSGTTIRTTASGRVIATGATSPVGAGGSQTSTPAAIVTSSSGASGARDD
jgi:hypothetical protein